MARINRNYEKLPGSYLFSEIARRTAAYQEANPEARLIKICLLYTSDAADD